jgi:substrate import-associated zinc metallohydrolase lipoprotein
MISARITNLRLGALASIVALVVTSSCYEEEKLNVPVKQTPVSDDPIVLYIQENFIEEYGVAVRFKYEDIFIDPTKRVVPPRREVVIPMLEFLTDLWIEPWIEVPNGEKFFKKHVPAEVVFIGSSIFNNDGTVTLGTADAGARITLTEVNDINVNNPAWVFRQLGTIYNLPPNWERISPAGYTSAGSWYNLNDEEALQRGFVSPYGTSSFNEDFAEFVAFLLFEPDFYERYINDEVCTDADCVSRNEGRALLRKKYTAILAHYKQFTGVDLLKVRELIQAKL